MFLGLACLLLVRSFVEIDILNPYQVGSFLFYFTAGKLALPKPADPGARTDGRNLVDEATGTVELNRALLLQQFRISVTGGGQ